MKKRTLPSGVTEPFILVPSGKVRVKNVVESWGMVKLSPDQQRYFLSKAPDVFDLASGAWGRSGSTVVRLALAKKAVVKAAILAAFKNVAASKNMPNQSLEP